MNNGFFKDKTAVVTGAGGTLCSAVAKHLSSLGCKVALVGRTREKLEKVADEIAAVSPERRPLVAPCDVSDEKSVAALAQLVLSELGPCRLLVNGAGGNDPAAMPTRLRFSEADLTPAPDPKADRGFFDIDMAAFRRVLEINTVGTVLPSRAFGLQMARAGGGAILNFASMNTYRPLTRVAPYAMAKAGIANWTQFFAQYMAPAHVRVNAVAPGFMVNERSRKYLCTPDGGLSPRGEQVMAHTPMGRFGEAEDLLGCVEWLLDDTRAAFVTGITVPVDGGFLASAGV